jgi:predicted metal-binding membrane protein
MPRAAADRTMVARIFLGALRHDRILVPAGLAVVTLLAWVYLLLGAGMETRGSGGGQMLPMQPLWSLGYAAIVFVMWSVMMVAMMLPAAAPMTLLVARIARTRAPRLSPGGDPAPRGDSRLTTALFVLGYLAVWVGFSAAATALQWALDTAGLLSGAMALGNTVLAGGVLAAAGIYQWTPLKAACLRHCRSPLDFLMFHWRDGAFGALASGMRHGAFCLGCCWMLMALLFVGGVMSLAWIGALALLVLIEKTLPWGGHMSRLTGAVLVIWGLLTLTRAIGILPYLG